MLILRCKKCGDLLYLFETRKQIYLRCRSCGTDFPLSEYPEYLDDNVEKVLAEVRFDKL